MVPGATAAELGRPAAAPRRRLPGLRRSWPALLALAILALALLLETRDRAAAEDLVDLGQMALYAVVTALALRAARGSEDPGQRRAWAWLAVAAGLALVAYLILIPLSVAGQPIPKGDDLIGFLVVVNALAFVGLVLLGRRRWRCARGPGWRSTASSWAARSSSSSW